MAGKWNNDKQEPNKCKLIDYIWCHFFPTGFNWAKYDNTTINISNSMHLPFRYFGYMTCLYSSYIWSCEQQTMIKCKYSSTFSSPICVRQFALSNVLNKYNTIVNKKVIYPVSSSRPLFLNKQNIQLNPQATMMKPRTTTKSTYFCHRHILIVCY